MIERSGQLPRRRAKRPPPTLMYEHAFWRDGFTRVAGLDEAGRGALAGPVVAAAVILPCAPEANGEDPMHGAPWRAIARTHDSKLLAPRTRESLFEPLCRLAVGYGIGAASPAEIDALNIVRASQLAMRRALEALPVPPDALLLDALVLPEELLPQQGIIHGDGLALSIAAASVLAEVARDRIMCALDDEYPGYLFARHKGYGTRAHLAALRAQGASPIHRQSFAPVNQLPTADG